MKHKFSKILAVGLTLALLISMLVTAVPVAALTEPTVAVDPLTLDTAAKYTIGFDVITGLAQNIGSITVKFPVDTDVPTSYVDGDITVDGTSVLTESISVTGQEVTITTPVGISGGGSVEVIFTAAADITNPTTGGDDYTLQVKTSEEPIFVTSEAYIIGVVAVVNSVSPGKGNDGDTMWVEVKGSGFVDDGTIFDFGLGVSVVDGSYHFVSTEEIDCQITITAAGDERYVTPTTWAAGTTTGTFDPNLVDTPQVDVWLKYTPDDDPFDGETLDFKITKDTIALGITEATDGTLTDQQVLIVHAGTYTENPVIDNDYVTIKSLSGATSTIIDGSVGDFGVTLDGIGLTIEDLTIDRRGSVGGQAGVRLSAIDATEVGDGFTIKGCTFSDWGTGQNEAVIGGLQFGLFTTGVTVTGGLIEGNTFSGNARTAIWLQTSGGVLDKLVIKDNYLLGCIETSDGHGIRLQGEIGQDVAGAASIEGNTISDMSGTAIILRVEEGSTDTGEVTITDNDISNCYQGVDATAAWNASITENTIENNRENGIKIGDGTQGTFVIKYNDISGNTEYGLKNEDAALTITAQYNYWGAIGGPSDDPADTATTALGSGDVVTTRVTYDPWLTEDQATAVSYGIAYHGSTTPLEAGWNTLSVPLVLKDSANTIAEIENLGDFLTDVEIVYQYIENDWQNVGTSAIELVPGRGYYIKTLAAVDFPVLYSGALGLPAFDLPAGWNLIGSGFGIDKGTVASPDDYGIAATSDTADGQKAVNEALDSIKASASVVISPSMPGQEGVWSILATSSTEKMIVGESYWVFMTAPATLAGFEVTPIYWIDLP